MSNQYSNIPEDKDPALWEIAQKRASFKTHAIAYLLVNAFLWAYWLFRFNWFPVRLHDEWPWPLWTTLGWGLGLAFHFVGAYVLPKGNLVENEYQKLINKK